MTTKVQGCRPGMLSGATLWLGFSLLAGCNVVAGILGVGFSSSVETSRAQVPLQAAPRELRVSLRPGVALWQAAARAPHAVSALSRAARGLGEVSLLDGTYLRAVSENLLDEGLMLPGPLGMLEVRLEVQPIAGEPIAVVPVDGVAPSGSAPGCAETAVPPSLVGAYRAGRRLLILRADGSFVLQGGAEPAQSGSYSLGCQVLQLAQQASPPLRLKPTATDGWSDPTGTTFRPLVEQHHGEHR